MGFLQRKLLKWSKGIILVETILSVGLTTVIISMTLPVMLRFCFLYNKQIMVDRSNNYAQEALLFIENEINQNTLSVTINNKIIINKLDGSRKEIYYKDNGSILLSYYQYGKSTATNIILRNIEDFKIIPKGNVIYLYIITPQGKKIERCLKLTL